MSISPIAFGSTIEITVPWDKENPTIWIIGPLDSITKTKMLSEYMTPDIKPTVKDGKPDLDINFTAKMKPLEQDLEILRMGLRGFKNFVLDGKPIEFKTTKKLLFGTDEYVIVSDETIKHIPRNVIKELANAIWGETEISEEEEKN